MTLSRKDTTAILLALAIGVALLPQPVDARGGQGPRIDFETLDQNGDGEVTQAEMDAHRAARFAAADANDDGLVSKDELLARIGAERAERASRHVDRMMERLDANDDGTLSQDELAARGSRGDRFERLDTDGSGGVSKEEFETARENHRGKWGRSKN